MDAVSLKAGDGRLMGQCRGSEDVGEDCERETGGGGGAAERRGSPFCVPA